MKWRAVALALVWSGVTTATILAVEQLELSWPASCQQGETCWIANYVDVDVTTSAQDFQCKPRTYDGHDGVDIAIRDLGVMNEGVAVLAAAAGTVRHVRDGMEDVPVTDAASRARIKSKECGNGVVVQHEGDWETQYCHLQKGSVRVKAGEPVERGAQLGLIGLSGKTEFPHVHLTVRQKGTILDPFTGQAKDNGCGIAGRALWHADAHVIYEDVALYNAGFSGGAPNIEMIRLGERGDPLTANSPGLVLWVDILGVQAGDTIRMTITGPTGQHIVERQQTIERTQARRFLFAGPRLRTERWPAGQYAGEVTLQRQEHGQVVEHSIHRTITIAS